MVFFFFSTYVSQNTSFFGAAEFGSSGSSIGLRGTVEHLVTSLFIFFHSVVWGAEGYNLELVFCASGYFFRLNTADRCFFATFKVFFFIELRRSHMNQCQHTHIQYIYF